MLPAALLPAWARPRPKQETVATPASKELCSFDLGLIERNGSQTGVQTLPDAPHLQCTSYDLSDLADYNQSAEISSCAVDLQRLKCRFVRELFQPASQPGPSNRVTLH